MAVRQLATRYTYERETLAKKIASCYLDKVRTINRFSRPWVTSTPVEDQPDVWSHLLATADAVRECDADPRQWIEAQFDGLSWVSRKKVPWLSQLHSASAYLRWTDWTSKQLERESYQPPEAALVVKDPFKLEGQKLKAMSRRFKMDEQKVLTMMPNEFTMAFHQQKGTWQSVRSVYSE